MFYQYFSCIICLFFLLIHCTFRMNFCSKKEKEGIIPRYLNKFLKISSSIGIAIPLPARSYNLTSGKPPMSLAL